MPDSVQKRGRGSRNSAGTHNGRFPVRIAAGERGTADEKISSDFLFFYLTFMPVR